MRPGDIVFMDNLFSHKGPRTRALIKAADVRLMFLPLYSPGVDPVDKALAKLKAHLRYATGPTVASPPATIGRFVDTFTPTECTNYFTAYSYRPDR